MNDNVSPKQLKDLRNEFESYLRNSHPHGSSVNVCDAFFVFNNHIVDDFWGSFVSEDSMLAVRDKIETLLLKRNKPASALERANRYLSALHHLKAFLDLKHPEYITPNKAISVINNQPSYLTQTERNFSSNKDLYKSGANKTRYDINAPQNSENQTELHIAALNGNADVTIRLIEAGADINVEDVRGWTPLDIAVDKGHTDIVTAFIKAGAEINNVDDKERTLLHYAASNGHRDTVIALIKAGIDVNARNVWGWTPLDNAVDNGHADVVIELIKAGSDLSSKDDDGWTLLHNAASKGYTSTALALIKARANVNAKDNNGQTPLHLATQNGHTDVTTALINADSDVNAQDNRGWTPLNIAVDKSRTDLVISLIKAATDITTKDDNGRTLLHYATMNNYFEITWVLIQAGANLDVKDNNGQTPLHLAVQNGHKDVTTVLINSGAYVDSVDNKNRTPYDLSILKGYKELADALIEGGAMINVSGNKGHPPEYSAADETHKVKTITSRRTATNKVQPKTYDGASTLHSAAYHGQIIKVISLIEAGVDVNTEDDMGRTVIYAAAEKGYRDITKVLIQAGAYVNTQDEYGQTPLHLASKSGHRSTVLTIIEADADVNVKDNFGWTPLHYASRNGDTDTVLTLIEAGADLSAKDNSGWTPLDYASNNGYTDTAMALLKTDANVYIKDKYCWELLHYAASNGHIDTVTNLLAPDAFVKIKYDDGLNFYDDYEDIETNLVEKEIEEKVEDNEDWLSLDKVITTSSYNKQPSPDMLGQQTLYDQIENSSFKAELFNVLYEYFPNGIRPNSVIDTNKLKKHFAEVTGKNITEFVLDIPSALKNCGVLYGDKVYVITPTAKQGLIELFDSILSNNNDLFFYDEIYDTHADFLQEIHVFSSELLKMILSKINPSLWYYKNYCLADPNATLETEILRCYKTEICLSYEQLRERLPYIPLTSIRQALSRNNDFIWSSTGFYTHISKIDFDEKECCEACAKIEEMIKTDGFASLISIDLRTSIEQNPQLTDVAVKSGFFQAYLASHYVKRGNIVSKNGTVLSANVVFDDFCLSRDKLTLDELMEFEKEINGNVSNQSLYAAYDNMVRIDKDNFIADDLIKFDVNATDNAIALFVKNDVIPITEVTSFTSFPYIEGYPWNWFLLESYCRRFSKKFNFQSLSVGNQNTGAIFYKNAGFATYSDALAAAVAVEPIKLNINEVGDFLFVKGYIARRTNLVTDVVTKAGLIRGRVF